MLYDEVRRRAIPEGGTRFGPPVEAYLLSQAEEKLRRRDGEIAILVQMLERIRLDAEEKEVAPPDPPSSMQIADHFNGAIQAVTVALARWIGIKWARHFVGGVLVRSGSFDPAWYLRHYDDVRAGGKNALNHYMKFGLRESRLPSRRLQTTVTGA